MIPDNKKVVYVTREIERALGMTPSANYRIVSNKTAYGDEIKKLYPEYVTLVENSDGKLLGTSELLESEITRNLLSSLPEAGILVFKNTTRVEASIKAAGRVCLNPRCDLSERVENKLSQIRWLGQMGDQFLPPHGAKLAKFITWKGKDPFIVQWAHGHTGDGTILVKTPEDLAAIQEKFPERMARITSFVNGPSFTVNAIVSKDRILMGNVSYQITGLQPFTDNQFSTIGNDWGVARSILTNSDMKSIEIIVANIGSKLQREGWKGLFGIDLIRDDSRKKIYLIEINARQPASSTYESTLQQSARENGKKGLTTFEAHLNALLDLPIEGDLIGINEGAQIVQRVTKNVQSVFDDIAGSLELSGYSVIAYQNNTPNSDLLRIQSKKNIMDGHNNFGPAGKEIIEAIKESHFKIEV